VSHLALQCGLLLGHPSDLPLQLGPLLLAPPLLSCQADNLLVGPPLLSNPADNLLAEVRPLTSQSCDDLLQPPLLTNSSRLSRWSLAMQPFQFAVEYQPGRGNANAESLSRLLECDMHVAGEGGRSVAD